MFTEEKLENAIMDMLQERGYEHVLGENVKREDDSDVIITSDLHDYLAKKYSVNGITESEISEIIHDLRSLSATDLYASNKTFLKWITNGYKVVRKERNKTDFIARFIDFDDQDLNIYKVVNQLEISGYESRRRPDGIVYINGLPVVVFEFKSAIREDATIHDAFVQLTVRYKRDIPQLFVYNAFCVISDGVNSKIGSLFADYEFFYAWRKVDGSEEVAVDGIDSLVTMLDGAFNHARLKDIIHNFIYIPDNSSKDVKIVCRYPQYYAARKLFNSILQHRKPEGDGKGGIYFGATGCGKSLTMLFLSRLLMKSVEMGNPTIVLITDRTDLDDQLSKQFVQAKGYIGDDNVISVASRKELRNLLSDTESGGVFLTTIQKFSEDMDLLSDRNNIICISDEAHRTQTNLDQKVKVTEDGVKKTYGFAKYLHDSLPNATYVGFTGTPVDASLEVFGDIVDSYTMTESVKDEITVPIVYEGRAAKVILDNSKLAEIEKYYDKCAEEGANEYQIEESKKASANMSVILSDPDRLCALANDFVQHYENRVKEGSTLAGKAMFVSSDRQIAWALYKEIIALRPEWAEERIAAEGAVLTKAEKQKIKPMPMIKMVMTRDKDDEKELWDILGTAEYRKELDRQFKQPKSNFKIAIVVDMWLTGFDVPELDTMYIDKPIQRHNLIQTISRVNRKTAGKDKGLIVDYIGIKKQMNIAMAMYSKGDCKHIEDIHASIVVVKDMLELLDKLFHQFDNSDYFDKHPTKQLMCLNRAAEYVQATKEQEKRFMDMVKRLKVAYDICSGSESLTNTEKDKVHFYLAVRSIVFKLTHSDAPDISQMNAKVKQMIQDALYSDGVEEIFKIGEDDISKIDIFADEYIERINKIKLPNTKIKLLQRLLSKALGAFGKVNRIKAIEFAKKLDALVKKYNERKEEDVLRGEVLEDFANEIIKLIEDLKAEEESFKDMGITVEEKAFYDILKSMMYKYQFEYPEDKLIKLSKEVATIVSDVSKYVDFNKRESCKAELKANLIVALAENDYPPVDKYDEVYKEVFAQAENFKANQIKKEGD